MMTRLYPHQQLLLNLIVEDMLARGLWVGASPPPVRRPAAPYLRTFSWPLVYTDEQGLVLHPIAWAARRLARGGAA